MVSLLPVLHLGHRYHPDIYCISLGNMFEKKKWQITLRTDMNKRTMSTAVQAAEHVSKPVEAVIGQLMLNCSHTKMAVQRNN